MKALPLLACSVIAMAGFAGIAQADDTATDVSAYKAKMHDCVTQMKADKPDMNYKARRSACHKQLGPSPKAMPAASPAPAPTPSSPPPGL